MAAHAEKFGEQYYVGPCLDGWVGVYPGMCQLESVGEALAKELKGTVWQVAVHDDDILSYWLWSKGELADSYYSNPGYFGEDNRADEERRKGNPKLLARLVGGREQELGKLLDRRRKPAFESERLLKLQKALGVKNLLASYEDLKRFGGVQTEEWPKFEEVPAEDVRKEREEKQRLRNQADSEWQRLKEEGFLLLHDPRIEDHAWGCGSRTSLSSRGPATPGTRSRSPPIASRGISRIRSSSALRPMSARSLRTRPASASPSRRGPACVCGTSARTAGNSSPTFRKSNIRSASRFRQMENSLARVVARRKAHRHQYRSREGSIFLSVRECQ